MSQNQNRTANTEAEIPLSMFENDDKMSYDEYQSQIRPALVEVAEQQPAQNEDCDCESGSEFLEDMPTNETYSISEGNEGNDDQAIKFLTETGMLTKLDGRIHFDLN